MKDHILVFHYCIEFSGIAESCNLERLQTALCAQWPATPPSGVVWQAWGPFMRMDTGVQDADQPAWTALYSPARGVLLLDIVSSKPLERLNADLMNLKKSLPASDFSLLELKRGGWSRFRPKS